MPSPRKVLVVDDDAHIRDVVSFTIRRAGLEVLEAADGRQALDIAESEAPDLILLDILMPELEGIDVCRAIRRTSNVPILFLSSKDRVVDRVIGLDAGGDDYVTKPFSPRELLARVQAIFRRIDALEASNRGATESGPLRIDAGARLAYLDGEALSLTRTEFGMLATLARHAGDTVDRETLMRGAYPKRRVVSDRTIDSHIRRLREKLRAFGADPIRTMHGVGYRLSWDNRTGVP
ncbi:MAG: response regulator transcription factor [Gammaproteobacteria bacterium]|nr:response regulator transcription factor [Gammaproteobacteria bacterium]